MSRAASKPFDIVIESPSAGSETHWPVQGAASYLPAVRNRNAPSVSILSPGRGFGTKTRHAYTQAEIGRSTAGTTPAIIRVTNRNNSGAGSLRAALEASGPRIVVFDVGGRFPITDDITIVNRDLWVAGQTAPSQVMIDNVSAGNHGVRLRASDLFIQHVIFWHSAPVEFPGEDNGNNDNAVMMSGAGVEETWNNVVIDHCFIGGGTDQVLLLFGQAVNDVTILDSIIGCARGKDPLEEAGSNFHQFIASIGSVNQFGDFVSLIGNVWTGGKERVPQVVIPHYAGVNQLTYDRGNTPMALRGGLRNGTEDHYQNVVGHWDRRGPNYSGGDGNLAGALFIGRRNGEFAFSSASQVHVNDCVAPNYVSDEWDVVGDPDDQEGTVRVDSVIAAAWPEGLVAAPMRAITESQRLELMLKNAGPRPNERISYIQDLIDRITDEETTFRTNYDTPTVSDLDEPYDDTGLSHDEGVEAGRSVWEERLLDGSEALLSP